MAQITLSGIAHSYNARPEQSADWALKRLEHVWDDGGAYALLGPSGCGKTTLLNIISGLITPTEGQVLFDQRDVTEITTEARNIAQVFQFPVVYDTMTVRQNLAFPLLNRGVDRTSANRRVEEVAEMLDLAADLDRRAHRLTADAKQKVSLGRGLVRSDVSAILFDEPLTVIDPHLKWLLRSQLKQLHRDFDFTMIYVTHDQTEALTFADQVVVMYEGEVVQVGTPEELFERPAHTFVGYFIGSPGMNLLTARVTGKRAVIAGHEIALARGYPALPPGASVKVGVRPEFIRITRDGDGLPVTVRKVDDVGRLKVVRVALGELPLNLVVDEDEEIPTSDVRVRFDPAYVHVYVDEHIAEGEAV